MIVQSGNDASVALAEYVAGSEDAFVTLMNQYARMLGMTGTHFADATGLPNPDHYSTPHDMAKLAAALIRRFPEFYKTYSIKEFTYNGIKQYNRNKLLWRDQYVDGMKTGHTESAGYCLVSSAKRGDMRLVSVVMGTDSDNARARESEKLLSYGFRFFETHMLYAADKPLKNMRIWKGATDQLALGLENPLYVTVPRGQYDKLKASLTVEQTITAPAQKGQHFGTVNVTLGDKSLAKRPLVALQNVKEGGLWERMVDNVMMLFQ
jgi:D-alanyl-D-alanine carboxypeptidase (penicillin-binding protein 5/6)